MAEPALGSLGPELELGRMSGLDLNLMVPLLALLEERSVTYAASRVGLSQPAMSHALRRLRRLLGDELLVRDGGGMVLTPRAEALLAPVRAALESSVLVLDPRPFDPATDHRVVTIALTTSSAFIYGPLLVRTLEQRAPHVELVLRTTGGQSTGVFADRGVDAVLLPQGYDSPYPRERLWDDRWVVLAAGAPDGRTARELIEREPHTAFIGEAGQLMRPYAVLDAQGVDYSVRRRVTDYLVVPHLIAEVGGVALHRYQAARDLAAILPLQTLEFPFEAPGLGIDLIWNPWHGENAFRAWLRGVLFEAAAPLRERAHLRL